MSLRSFNAAPLEAFVLDTEPVVVHIDRMPQELSIGTAVHLPDRLLVVPGILDHKVGRMTPVVLDTAVEVVDNRAAAVPSFCLALNFHSLQLP